MPNVLVIGDTHAPFTLDGYLKHLTKTYERFNCTKVVHIGDIIDQHYSSFHQPSPDGFGAGEELTRAVASIAPFYEAFPNVTVCLGNHDRIVLRKAFASGVSERWIKDFNKVLEVPKWKFVDEHEIDDVIYIHGTGNSGDGAALRVAKERRQSVVMGHVHTSAGVLYSGGGEKRIFGMQVGCGLDKTAYAFQYAQGFAKNMVMSCGVVLDKGSLPIVVPM